MVFHGFWLVSMVFHGSRLVCHGSRLVLPQNVPAPNCILARQSSVGPPPGERHRTYCPNLSLTLPLYYNVDEFQQKKNSGLTFLTRCISKCILLFIWWLLLQMLRTIRPAFPLLSQQIQLEFKSSSICFHLDKFFSASLK